SGGRSRARYLPELPRYESARPRSPVGERVSSLAYSCGTFLTAEVQLGADLTVTSEKRWSLSAFLTASSFQALLSLRLKRSSRVLKSIWIVPCSTHGRVASAVRTRSGQPLGQDMAGTESVTSVGAAGAT